MTLFFTFGGIADMSNTTVPLGKIAGLTMSAQKGAPSQSGLPIDDPAGALLPGGLKSVYINETACSVPRLWTGYSGDRKSDRGVALRTGAARTWDGSLHDLNAIFGFYAIHTLAGSRPVETCDARIAYVLSALSGRIADNGKVSSSTQSMDATDYRGQTFLDVLNDCAELTGYNFFAYTDPTTSAGSLAFFPDSYTGFDSTLRLTNVLADVIADPTSTIAATATLTRNPDEVYSGVYVMWAYGSTFVRDAATEAAFGSRETVLNRPNIGRVATATHLADRFLMEHATEQDGITVQVKLPASKVNLIQAGQRIQIKFSHLDSYSSGYTYIRCVERTVAQDEEDDSQYNVTLQLTTPKGTSNSGNGAGGSQPVPPGALPFVPGGAPAIVGSQCGGPTVAGVADWATSPISIGWTPAAGNLLVFIGVHRGGGSMVPTGPGTWTAVHDNASADFWHFSIGAKIADGTETQITVSQATQDRYCLYELSGPTLADIGVVALNGANATEVTSYGPGTIAAPSGTAFFLFGMAVNYDFYVYFDTLTASWTMDYPTPAGTAEAISPNAMMAHYITSGNQSPTAQWHFSPPGTATSFAEAIGVAIGASGGNLPMPGQLVTETFTGDGTTVTRSTTYSYAIGSLSVWVDGVAIIAGLTATNGTSFTLDFAPLGASGDSAAEKIVVKYQRAP